ncbi:unnamed protein product, partial [Heligmosomoides polygyrus]|uniref:DAZ-associated protein 2 n=1 Tax=Heligmosomoides polygyrus TaxID=6339 RepID=A0A183FCX1_HELPZ
MSAPTYPIPYDQNTAVYTNGQVPMPMPVHIPTSVAMVSSGSPRPHSTVAGPTVTSPPGVQMQSRPMSMPPNGAGASPVQFIPVCRYEDSQAIRAVAFHP